MPPMDMETGTPVIAQTEPTTTTAAVYTRLFTNRVDRIGQSKIKLCLLSVDAAARRFPENRGKRGLRNGRF